MGYIGVLYINILIHIYIYTLGLHRDNELRKGKQSFCRVQGFGMRV